MAYDGPRCPRCGSADMRFAYAWDGTGKPNRTKRCRSCKFLWDPDAPDEAEKLRAALEAVYAAGQKAGHGAARDAVHDALHELLSMDQRDAIRPEVLDRIDALPIQPMPPAPANG